MEDFVIDRRQRPRPEAQQQPQQCLLDPQHVEMERGRASHEAEREALQALAMIQARKQSGKL